jgi:triosephosphate isomerase
MPLKTPLIVGNWKMHGRAGDLGEARKLVGLLGTALDAVDVVLCPPATYLAAAVAAGGPKLGYGGQDCSAIGKDGARTGEVSAGMLADAGAKYVIVGHSERRSYNGESDELVRQKAAAALEASLLPIICVGESRADRDAGRAVEVVTTQVRESLPQTAAPLAIAYEPIWAIGGDRPPSSAEIAEVHAALTALAPGVRLLYGGAVNPQNAREIFSTPGVDGALVGRASLKAADFAALIKEHPAAV